MPLHKPCVRVLGIGRRPFPDTLAGVILPADYCRTDLARPEAALVARGFLRARGVERLDILIHNAAMGWYGAPAQQASGTIDEMLALKVNAPIALTHMLLSHMSRVRGAVVFVSSLHAALPAPDFAVYTVTKAALDGFARSLRSELRSRAASWLSGPAPCPLQCMAEAGFPPRR